MASVLKSDISNLTPSARKAPPAGLHHLNPHSRNDENTPPAAALASPLLPIKSPIPAPWSRTAMLRKCAHAFVMALASPEFDPHTFVRTFLDPEHCRITHHGPRWAGRRLPYLSPASASGSASTSASASASASAKSSGAAEESEFVGRDGCLRYLDQLGSTLKTRFFEDAFPADEQLCVDADATVPNSKLTGRVCLDGRGRFEHRETGWRWEETFVYRLSGFNEDGQVEHWEIWSDTLSAWEAASDDKKSKT